MWRRGRLSDRHIGVREQRTKPLALGLLSVLVGLAVLVLFHAPRELVALVVALFVGGLVATVVNHFWKLSVHASVAAVGRSRVHPRDHTVLQVFAGTVVGAVVAGVTFGLLR